MKTLVDKFSTAAYAFPRAPCGDGGDAADHHVERVFLILLKCLGDKGKVGILPVFRRKSTDGADGRILICEGLLCILLTVC